MLGASAGRAIMLGMGMALAGILLVLLYRCGPHADWLPGCMFHRLTGLHCPGCGMTRATDAVLHGQIGKAFHYNFLGMVLFPLALLALGFEAIGWVRGKPLPFRFHVGGSWPWWILWLIVVFWLLRNIPLWPCSLLAPPL